MQGLKKWSDQVRIGSLTLSNRVVLSALTRCRTNPLDSIPNDLLVKYYQQRSGAGLLLT